MPDQKKVITLTINPTVDKSSSVDNVASEIKLRCDPPTFDPGGGGINVSRAIKKLGGDSTAIFTSGGGTGQMLQELLDAEGISQRPVPIQGMTRENLTIFEKLTTLQYRFGMPGPELTDEEIDACVKATFEQHADYIVASGSLTPGMPNDFYARLAQQAEAVSGRLIVDTSGAALEALANQHVFLLKPNIRELEILTGEEFRGDLRVQSVAQQLIRDGLAEVLVISMGAGGAAFVTADDYMQLRPPVVPIRSKVGAGDSMVGGIVLGLAQGRDLLDAVRYGVAAGSAAVMTHGTQLCRKEDTDEIYERIRLYR